MRQTKHTISEGFRRTLFVCAALVAIIGTVTSTLRPAQVSAACGGGCVASMSAAPGSGTYNPGNTITVSVYVNSGGQSVNAVQADFTYTASRLEYQSINTAGSAFDVAAPSSGGSGSVSIARGSVSGVSGGSLLVAQVSFKVLSNAGTASISFSSSSEVYNTSNSDILGSKSGATYTVDIPVTPPPSTPAAPTTPTSSPTYTQPGPTPSSGTNKKPTSSTPSQPAPTQSTPESTTPTTTEQPKTTAATDTSKPTTTNKTNTWLMPALIIGGVVVLGAGAAGTWLMIRRRMTVIPSGTGGTMPSSDFITGPSMPPVQPPTPPSAMSQDGSNPVDHRDDMQGPTGNN